MNEPDWYHTSETLAMQGVDYSPSDLAAYHAVPAPPPGWVRSQEVYAVVDSQPLEILLYRPDGTDTSPRPCVLFLHGGGWRTGSPLANARFAGHWAAKGWVAGGIQYRLGTDHRHPAALEDARAAIRWVRANHRRLAVDPERIVVGGGSAGAHLCLLAAFLPDSKPVAHSDDPTDVSSGVAAVFAISPLVDLREHDHFDGLSALVEDFVGTLEPPALRNASPVAYVSTSVPPVLTVTGDADPLIPLGQLQRFDDALEEAGVEHRLIVLPGRVHGFDLVPDGWELAFRTVNPFIDAHVGVTAPSDGHMARGG